VVTEPEKVDTELRISLNRADNDFECFFHCPLMAWEEVQPEVMENPFGALLGAMFLSEHLVQ
jgi:hypothetical protein